MFFVCCDFSFSRILDFLVVVGFKSWRWVLFHELLQQLGEVNIVMPLIVFLCVNYEMIVRCRHCEFEFRSWWRLECCSFSAWVYHGSVFEN